MEFKLLALKINAESSFTKNIRKGILYQFANDHKFIFKKNADGTEINQEHKNLVEIKSSDAYPRQLFDLKGEENTCDVNVTAVIGKNGSGKSTILELLYLFTFCLSERKRLKRDRERNVRSASRNKELSAFFKDRNARINEILSQTCIEIYYKLGQKFYFIENSRKSIIFKSFENGKWIREKFELNQFFYTICVNYSIYGLNSSGKYFWLDALFHKNDGYRVPLVISPWREQGNIDINNELHLAQTRVISNIIDDSFVSENIIDKKQLEGFEFTIAPDKIGRLDPYSLGFIYRNTKKQRGIDLITVLERFIDYYRKGLNFAIHPILDTLRKEIEQSELAGTLQTPKYDEAAVFDKTFIQTLLAKYLLTKIIKIVMRYPAYNRHLTTWNSESPMGEIKLVNNEKDFLRQLWQDQTHVTLKLKQAVNAFLFQYLVEFKWQKKRNPEKYDMAIYTTEMNFQEFSDMAMTSFRASKQKDKKVNEFIPTGFFRPTLILSDQGKKFSFSDLSSGEQQMIHSIHSIIYHILNLESLKTSPNNYQVVNIILDEIELYYHPEYQRQFIDKLLSSLKKLKLSGIKGLNMIFSSHSPFILSDIPHCNVLKLSNGAPIPFDDQKRTFGSNIHEMLTDAFFLDENLMGAFAEKSINDCLKSLRLLELGKLSEELEHSTLVESHNLEDITKRKVLLTQEIRNLQPGFDFREAKANESQNKSIYKIINIIGEPVVRYKLLDMYMEILYSEGSENEKAKQEIYEIMKRHNINLEDL